jgi:hypothetical protein
MAKAWRNENAAKINARRKDGSKEGTARQQKGSASMAVGSGNYLLDGLLIKEGYVLPEIIPTTQPFTRQGKSIFSKLASWFRRK